MRFERPKPNIHLDNPYPEKTLEEMQVEIERLQLKKMLYPFLNNHEQGKLEYLCKTVEKSLRILDMAYSKCWLRFSKEHSEFKH